MRCVDVKVLKNNLSKYLRLVAAGETVLVTDGDRVIAELTPPREDRSSPGSDAVIGDVVRKGWITPAAVDLKSPPPRLPVDRHAKVLEELEADREER
ncbi:MAG TPA: prevent-host-death protein [Planctomycetota bacterium]|nr:prevent-host-death protein [Planctomycetota bacterium]